MKTNSSVIKLILGLILLAFFAAAGFAQNAEKAGLEKDFPVLSKRAEAEAADFVMAIDRSGSMRGFWAEVKNSLIAFLDSVPDGDYVSVLAFGVGAENLVTPRPLNAETRRELIREISALEEPKDGWTDIGKGLEKTLDELNRPNGNRLKFVFLFTDFAHDPPRDSAFHGKSNPTDDVWQQLASRRANEQSKNIIQSFALLLPLDASVGRDLKLGKAVFPALEQINVSRGTLLPWFERRKAEIARQKLQSVVGEAVERPPLKFRAIAEKGGKLFAEFDLDKDRIVETREFNSVKIENINFGALADRLTAESETPQKFAVENAENPVISVPLARINDLNSFWAWSETAEISFELKAVQMLEPADEIKRLNLSPAPEFAVNVSEAEVSASGGYLALWHVLAAVFLVLIILFFILRRFRPEYLSGSISVIGEVPQTLRKSEKRQVFEVGSTDEKKGIVVENAGWTLIFEAFAPPKRPRGIYVSVKGNPTSAVLKLKGKETILGERPTPISRGAEIEIENTQIWFN